MAYDYSNLQGWIAEWESPSLEFKASVSKKLGESISAFANTYGGLIVIGVDPKSKTPIGLNNPDEESRHIREQLDECQPNPKPDQQFIRHAGKTFIVLHIEPIPYSQNPCFFGTTCYIRQGTTNLALTGQELIDFLKRRTILNFEELKSTASLNDIDLSKFDILLEKRKIKKEHLKEDDIKTIMHGLRIASTNGSFYLKNVALQFFSKEPQKHFSNLETRIVKYKTTEATVDGILLDERVMGTIPELINVTFDKILRNTNRQYIISGLERKQVSEYPEWSLREAITNAFGHRDYFDQKDVLVEIFPDRLQITNPGGLLPGQSLHNFDKTPQHRNNLIYRLLHDLGLGEGLGLGIKTIRREFRQRKLPDPEFYELGNAFQVIFYNPVSDRKRLHPSYINDRQRRALAYLGKNNMIKAAEYAKISGVTAVTAVKDLNELVKQGRVKKIGKYRGAYYTLG